MDGCWLDRSDFVNLETQIAVLLDLGRLTAANNRWLFDKRDFPRKVPVSVELVTPENVGQYGDYGKKP